MARIRIILADDHPVVRAGIRGMLEGQPDFDIVAEAESGSEVTELARELKPDVILMDLRMPVTDGVAATAAIRASNLACHVLVLTTYDTDADILRAIEAGATGYLLKDAPRQELYQAIRATARGEVALASPVAARLLQRVRSTGDEALSVREIEVLAMVARGASNGEVAQALHVSIATVKTHLVHIFEKLGVSDRTSAVTTALERGIIRLD